MAFDAEVWNVVSKKSTKRGVWIHLRHLGSVESVWFSSAHFCPGVTQGQYEQQVEDHFRSMPRVAKMVIFQGDLNSSFRWHRVDERVDAIGKDGKSDIFARYATEAGLDFVPFGPSQWNTPTSRPRQAHRIGTQIDYMLTCFVKGSEGTIATSTWIPVTVLDQTMSVLVPDSTSRQPEKTTGAIHGLGFGRD